MRDMISVILEGALDGELDDELVYSKYDYRNNDNHNSHNGKKVMYTSYGDVEFEISHNKNGEYEPDKEVSKYNSKR